MSKEFYPQAIEIERHIESQSVKAPPTDAEDAGWLINMLQPEPELPSICCPHCGRFVVIAAKKAK